MQDGSTDTQACCLSPANGLSSTTRARDEGRELTPEGGLLTSTQMQWHASVSAHSHTRKIFFYVILKRGPGEVALQ